MATVIRLARYGAKKRPYYHVVVTDSRNARNSGAILETVGKYNPMLDKKDEKRVVLNIEKIKDWMAKGAKPSDRVYKFLVNAGLVAASIDEHFFVRFYKAQCFACDFFIKFRRSAICLLILKLFFQFLLLVDLFLNFRNLSIIMIDGALLIEKYARHRTHCTN